MTVYVFLIDVTRTTKNSRLRRLCLQTFFSYLIQFIVRLVFLPNQSQCIINGAKISRLITVLPRRSVKNFPAVCANRVTEVYFFL